MNEVLEFKSGCHVLEDIYENISETENPIITNNFLITRTMHPMIVEWNDGKDLFRYLLIRLPYLGNHFYRFCLLRIGRLLSKAPTV